MDIREDLDQIEFEIEGHDSSVSERLKKTGLYVGVLLAVIWYGYTVFFGENSYQVMKELQEEKQQLIAEIRELRKSNTELQRRYFNLKVANDDGGNTHE
jgi:cell division protein FtsB